MSEYLNFSKLIKHVQTANHSTKCRRISEYFPSGVVVYVFIIVLEENTKWFNRLEKCECRSTEDKVDGQY